MDEEAASTRPGSALMLLHGCRGQEEVFSVLGASTSTQMVVDGLVCSEEFNLASFQSIYLSCCFVHEVLDASSAHGVGEGGCWLV